MAISLVFLTGLAWMGTILTLLVSLTTARRGRGRKLQEPSRTGRSDSGLDENGA
ncbi:hypothetical protein J2X98_001544 [Pseudarthrobacter enclensis]|uniref:MetS family NSS transporter small subunit n=1 Tax=Pseudarthrobacter enclensis TaxID=993070 RepID=A0ABT9RT61_9MICC|nr:hypothetical protein [Pseudarthrobacter enclensis]